MNILLISSVLATPRGPYIEGFLSPERLDAPTDGEVLLASNFLPVCTAADDLGSIVELVGVHIRGVGEDGYAAYSPPPGGWVAGRSYILGATDDYGTNASLIFSVAADVAPPPQAVTVGDVVLGPWSEPTTYPGGCCFPVRTVTIDAHIADSDTWSRVELIEHRDDDVEVNAVDWNSYLAIKMGPGDHEIQFEQWCDDFGPQPPCFDLVPISASGEIGDRIPMCAQEACAPDDSNDSDESSDSDNAASAASASCGGCASSRGGAHGLLGIGLALAYRRRPSTHGVAPRSISHTNRVDAPHRVA